MFYGKDFTILSGILGSRGLTTLNTGGAWSIMSDHPWLLILITVVFLTFIIFVDAKYKVQHTLYKISFSLIIGGALGNLIDRIFLGGVRDFLFFEFWKTYPTFNVADSFLLVGTILLLVYIVFFGFKNEKETKDVNSKQ